MKRIIPHLARGAPSRRLGLVVALVVSALAPAAPAVAKPATDTADRAVTRLTKAEADVVFRQARTDAALEEQVALYMKRTPGGTRISKTEVSYDDGAFVMEFADPARAKATVLAEPDCPSGWYCFYEGYHYRYPRGRLSDCGWQDLARWNWQDRMSSYHNTTPRLVFLYNHVDPAHIGDEELWQMWGYEAWPNLPWPTVDDKVDHVEKWCP